jgi:aminoglycoside phosphotransferase (APT) family kinase protein
MDGSFSRLAGGNMGEVVRNRDTVVREAGEWTPAVHRLLRRLHDAGVRGIPRPVGVIEGGREVLSYVEGAVPSYPLPGWVWTDASLDSSARLLRQVHDATTPLDLVGPWRSPTREPAEVVCHNDFAPYNLVFHESMVIGAIDWDFASPGPRLWDLAYLAYRIVPLTTADWRDGFTHAQRLDRLRRLLSGYGTDDGPSQVFEVLHERLLDLASFSDRAAQRLHKPELHEHAELYPRDARSLVSG